MIVTDKWIVAGDWSKYHQEEAFSNALSQFGVSVIPFKIKEFMRLGWKSRLERKLKVGSLLRKINSEIIDLVKNENPSIIFFRKPTLITAQTVLKIKAYLNSPLIVTYNNDNPFFDGRKHVLWRHYLRVIRLADINFFYRPADVEEAENRSLPNPKLLMPYYIDEISINKETENQRTIDIGFIGHYEADGRLDYIEELVKYGITPTIVGPRWNEIPKGTIISGLAKETWLDYKSYENLVTATKVSLCFLSKVNRDVYTRRCFEIPALGSLLLCERTKELKEIFIENEEAVYFSSKKELVDKVVWLLNNETIRKQIAKAGHAKCIGMGHSITDRVSEVFKAVKAISMEIDDKKKNKNTLYKYN